MNTQDHELYEEYSKIEHRYGFAQAFCEWYRNGGKRPESFVIRRVRTSVNNLTKKGVSVRRIALFCDTTTQKIYDISAGYRITEKLAQEVVDRLDEWK